MNNSEICPLLPSSGGDSPRMAIFLSGSGSNAEKILEMLRNRPMPLQVVALVTDRPKSSRANEIGEKFGIPVVGCGIKAFYQEHGESRVSIATETGRQIRESWTEKLRQQLKTFEPDFGVLAGFVPLTNLVGDFPCLNVHPGDLTLEVDGIRILTGLHTIPIERAILEGLDHLRSSVVLVQPYSGAGDNMDSGPILGISEEVEINISDGQLEKLRECAACRPQARPEKGYGDELENLATELQQKLKEKGDWVVLPGCVRDFSQGKFGSDEKGKLHYRGEKNWFPIKTVIYGKNTKEIIFA